MTHDLVTTFTNGLGKEHDWTYKNVNADLPVEQIKEACELLTQLDIFEKNGVKLFDTVVTAKLVTTYETDIFDVENDPAAPSEQPCIEAAPKNDGEDSSKESSKEETTTEPSFKEEKMSTSSIKLEDSSFTPVKAGRSYDYLYNSSRNALEQALKGPAETRSTHPSLIIKNQTSGLKHTIDDNDSSASVPTPSATAQTEEKEQLSTRKRFLSWLRRKKNRNKDDPDSHSHDPDVFR
ncbi:DUF2922 domain-containing protein [Candidatus Enterococcus murrayae]|uniref:DUF2922 domain-containing protein n=1 Tax=Candidatus Enterococcus murrayae TaxID=2815321 RepID=A0ABS3HMF2_9ENTE|nr:DUF2922 domain-containing protein [Enterococcus sp. MJM16]MBO0453768.1 DUF2922 domain-containing protein [Enterococcus sp. MJM16]